jgi:colanic acid/amylovoran biosynthesis glycosyltransferase
VSARRCIVHAVGQWLGPTETWLYNQIARLPRRDFDVRVVANRRHPNTPAAFAGVDVSAFSDKRFRYTLQRMKDGLRRRALVNELLRDCLASETVDLVHSHFGPTGWATSRLTTAADVRHVVTFYGYDVSWLPRRRPEWRMRYTELFAQADVVLCEGTAMAEAIAGLGCPRAKLRVHHLGIDVEAIEFRPRALTGDGPLRVLMAARFFEKKGFPDGVRAIGRLRASGVPVSVTIVGGDDGSPESVAEHHAIRTAVTNAGLESASEFVGMQPAADLMRLAYDHHLFLSPSRTSSDGDTEGGAPVAIIEMAASGMPVVSTTHCDIPGVLGEPNRALLTPEGEADGLYRQLLTLLYESDWASLATANRRHVERDFNVYYQSEKLADIYLEVIANA